MMGSADEPPAIRLSKTMMRRRLVGGRFIPLLCGLGVQKEF
jgi:hypothetical protein